MRRYVPLWVVPVLVILSVGTVWLRLLIVRTTYSISETDRQVKSLRHEREQMEWKVASLKSPKRLENLAKTHYGLGQPKSNQVVYIK